MLTVSPMMSPVTAFPSPPTVASPESTPARARSRPWSGALELVFLLADGAKPEVAPRAREVEAFLS